LVLRLGWMLMVVFLQSFVRGTQPLYFS